MFLKAFPLRIMAELMTQWCDRTETNPGPGEKDKRGNKGTKSDVPVSANTATTKKKPQQSDNLGEQA